MTRRLLIALGLTALVAAIADARPGGGESYSGGGGHSSGGGGGGGGGDGGNVFELVYWLIRLIIYAPQIGLPVLALVIGVVVYGAYKQQKNKDWDSGPPVTLKRAASMDPLRRVDPEFSQVLFEDFAFRLFSSANRARHTLDALATVAPYVGPTARQQLFTRTPGHPVESVVVGAMRTFRVDVPKSPVDAQGRPNRVRIGIEFEANVTTAEATYYMVARSAGKITKLSSVTDGAVGTADITLTFSIGVTAITTGVITIATAASAAGDKDEAIPTAANTVAIGDLISFVVTGGGAGGSPRGEVTVEITAQ